MVKINIGPYFSPKAIINLSILVGFIIFVTIVLSFLGEEIQNKTNQILEQRSAIETRINSISRLSELTNAAKEASSAFAELNALLPKRDDLVTFPRYIDTLARETGVNNSFSFRGEDVLPIENTPGHSAFALSISGSYGDILTFIEKLEGGRFIIEIETADVVAQRDGTSFAADMQGSVFFRD